MKPEARLQAWADRFIDRVVLPPMFTTAIDVGREWVSVQHAMSHKARGTVFGLPDALVAQGDGQELSTVAWIEYKRGTRLTARQVAAHTALQRVGFHVYTASSISDVLDALRLAGFRLHGNAASIAVEMEERLLASDRVAEAKKPRASKPRAARPSAATIARAHKAGVWG